MTIIIVITVIIISINIAVVVVVLLRNSNITLMDWRIRREIHLQISNERKARSGSSVCPALKTDRPCQLIVQTRELAELLDLQTLADPARGHQ